MRIQNMTIGTRYRKCGNELIVFIHGLGCSKASFSHAWSSPALQNYSLLAFDLPGFGDSELVVDFTCTMKNMAGVVEDIIQAHSAQRIHVVAHSMGGAIALLLPPERLNSLASLTSVEGNLVAADCGIFSRRIVKYPRELFLEEQLPDMKLLNKLLDFPFMALRQCSPRALYESSESLVEWSDSGKLLATFKSLPCPHAYMYGSQNRGMPVLLELEDEKTVSIEGAGHNMMQEQPDLFYPTLCNLFTSF